jgi:hypothetical protein
MMRSYLVSRSIRGEQKLLVKARTAKEAEEKVMSSERDEDDCCELDFNVAACSRPRAKWHRAMKEQTNE